MKINKITFPFAATSLGFKVESEFKFCPTRKFRADWKVSKGDKSVLVEYEGIYSKTSRHTHYKGYSKDCEKYNLAQIEGYQILRYTADNFDNVINDLEKVL